jgi:hypothetical protein
MLRFICLGILISNIIFVGCDNYSHNSYVNTNPANYLNITMIKSIGGSNTDWGAEVIATIDNGYVSTGSTYSFGLNRDSSSLYLAYVDSNGVVEWTNFYGGWGNDRGQAVLQTQSGDLIVAGASSSYELTTGIKWDPSAHPFIEWDYNFYLIKMNSAGFTYWEKVYGNSNSLEWGTSIAIASDGIVIAGYQGNNNPDEPIENNEFFVVKTDLDGELIWQNSYGTLNQDHAHSVAVTNDGEYIVGGFTYEDGSLIASPYIMMINSSGDLIWENIYGSSILDEKIYSLIETSDGGFVATGYSRTIIDNIPSVSTLYVCKISTNGAIIWENTYPHSNLTIGRSVIENEDGSLVICGVTTENGNINITKLEADGSLMWSQSTIVPGIGMDLAPISGGYALTGYSTAPANPGSSDLLIMEIIEDFTNIEL